MRLGTRATISTLALVVVAIFLGAPFMNPAAAQSDESMGTVVPGEAYEAGGLHKLLYGSQYRDLWTTPIEVPYLDLQATGGGLTPTGTGGGKQTIALRFVGADGKPYTFRSLDKSPEETLPPDLRDSYIATLAQDQISSSHPTAPLIVDPMLTAVGVLRADTRIVMLPDDPALGEYREQFAGRVGTFEEWPNEGEDGAAGFAGATDVVSTDELWENFLADPRSRAEVKEFLTARFVDLLIGDWDRHRGQWRWANVGSGDPPAYRPIPEDRDQAFAKYDGILLHYARLVAPQLTKFGKNFDSMLGMTWNGRDLDRWLLPRVTKAEWDSIALSVQSRITDEVIEDGLSRLPRAHYDLVAEELTRDLRERRDKLPEIAGKYYRHILSEVDLQASDQSDRIEVERLDDGYLLVRMYGSDSDTPYLDRRFDPGETNDVRIYLHGGDDQVRVTGDGSPRIKLRVISGNGTDSVDDATGNPRTAVYDHRPESGTTTNSGDVDRKSYPSAPNSPALTDQRDWGSRSFGIQRGFWAPDLDLVIAYDYVHQKHAFRKDPYGVQHSIGAAFSTGEVSGRLQYQGELHNENSRIFTGLTLLASGIENVRFFGAGNETQNIDDSNFFRTDQNVILVEPTFNFPLWRQSMAKLLVVGKYYSTEDDDSTFLTTTRPYGFGDFAFFGVGTEIVWDTRDAEAAATKGVLVKVGGSAYPEALDLELGSFGKAHASAAGLVSAGERLTFALRASGEKIWGDAPFMELAYVGGRNTVRGFNEDRFAGTGSAYANFEIRLRLIRYNLLVPGLAGIHFITDTGRVFLDGEDSDVWHTGVGGGIWVAPRDRRNTFSASLVNSTEGLRFYFSAGFGF